DPLDPAGADPLDAEAPRARQHPARTVTTLDDCHRCRHWSDRPGPDPEPLALALPRRGRRRGPRVRRWAVGVTTAPRGLPTLERVLWFDSPPGLVSLYCSSAYTRPEPGWHALGRAWTWGALAFVFPRALAMRFVTDPRVFGHRWSDWHEGKANIDVVIGRWAR